MTRKLKFALALWAVFASSFIVGTGATTFASSSGTLGSQAPLSNVIGASIGSSRFACVIVANGRVKCWGHGLYGQLGYGDTSSRGDDPNEMGDNLPYVDLGTGRTVKSLSVGGQQVCAILDNDKVKCWGQGVGGVLGLGDGNNRGDGPNEMGDNLPYVDLGTGRTVVTLSAGAGHTCAILDNGAVKCWGYNTNGQLGLGDTLNRGDGPSEMGDNLPVVNLGTGRTAVAVSAGWNHTCAILDNGSLKCWGYNSDGELGYDDATTRGDGSGEMGDSLAVINLGTGRTAKAVSAGQLFTCAILDNGTMKCWGSNSNGQLGLGDSSSRGVNVGEMAALPIIDLGVGRTAVQVSAGNEQTCVVLDNATAKCWGINEYGQLGYDNLTNIGDGAGEMGASLTAINVGVGRTARAISTGNEFTCASLDNHTVKCWGRNGLGELGKGFKEGVTLGDAALGDNSGEMTALTSLDLGTSYSVTSISTGESHTCAIFNNGSVKCWGRNQFGQLGYGDISNRGDSSNEMGLNLPFVDLGTGRTAISISAGFTHTCAILDNAKVKCWGRNLYGRLGYPDIGGNDWGDAPNEMGDNLAYVDLGTGRTASAISTGQSHTCAVLDDGTVKCWGYNNAGQLGYGDTTDRGPTLGDMGDNLPIVPLGVDASAIDTGASHTCALLINQNVKCWGYDFRGQVGSGTGLNIGDAPGEVAANTVDLGSLATAISLGDSHSCAILTSGSVKCWGYNNYGQLGRGDTTTIGALPNQMGSNLATINMGSGRTVVSIDSYGNKNCVVLDNSSAKCWGYNNAGQLGYGDTTNRGDGPNEMGDNLAAISLGSSVQPAQIAASTSRACARFTDGRMKCWGNSAYGGLGDGQTAVNVGDAASEMGNNLSFISLDSSSKVLAPLGRPNAPTSLSAQAASSNASLSWSPPIDNGGTAITGYRVDQSGNGSTWTTVIANTGSTATSALISSLLESTTYYFRIYALNATGTGLPSAAYSVSTTSSSGSGSNSNGGSFIPVTPSRMMDTRNGTGGVVVGKVGNGINDAGAVLEFSVLGKGGLPGSAGSIGAVSLNVTAANTTVGNEGGWVAVFPCGTTPGVSNLNFVSGQITPNAVITPISSDGKVCFKVYGKADLIADVNGYFAPAAGFTTVTPSRIMDTRNGTGGVAVGKVGNGINDAGAVLEFSVLGKGDLPGSAGSIGAVSLNVTAANTTVGNEGGWVAVFPCGTTPGVSNLNFVSGQITPNAVITPISSDGKVCFKVYGKADLIADVNGYFTASTPI